MKYVGVCSVLRKHELKPVVALSVVRTVKISDTSDILCK